MMTPEDKRCCGLAAAGKLERMGQTYLQLLAKLSTSMFAQRVSVLSAVFVCSLCTEKAKLEL